jgi:cytoskeletal protein RodZ
MSDETPTDATPAASPEREKSLFERIPRRLFGGKVRTTTAVLVVLFIGALWLYGVRSEHYDTIDEQARQAKISQVQQPRTTTPESEVPVPEPEYSESPTTTETPTTTPTTEGTEPTGPSSEAVPPPASTSESTRGGILPQWELPTISTAP